MPTTPRPGYPYVLALLNVLFIGLGVAAVLDTTDTELRHKLSGSIALLVTGAAQWLRTRRSGHPVWKQRPGFDGGTVRGRATTVSAVADALLVPLLFVAA